jgi:Replication protein P
MSSLMSQRSAWLDLRPIGDRQLSLMDHLFNRLDGMYPNRWRASFTSEDAVQNWRESWAEAFVEEGITPHQVADGIRACRRQFDWPPSLTEFLKACKPHIDHEAAFIEAVKQMRQRDNGTDTWSKPAIYWAAVEFGSWELRQASWDRAKARWTRILDEQLAKGELPPVPPRMEALPAPGQASANPEKVRELIEGLRKRMAVPKGAA